MLTGKPIAKWGVKALIILIPLIIIRCYIGIFVNLCSFIAYLAFHAHLRLIELFMQFIAINLGLSYYLLLYTTPITYSITLYACLCHQLAACCYLFKYSLKLFVKFLRCLRIPTDTHWASSPSPSIRSHSTEVKDDTLVILFHQMS